MRTLILFLTVLSAFSLEAQLASHIWYFGDDGAGIDFRPCEPEILDDHDMLGWEGVATISDESTGELLFYTNGQFAWNRDHVIMPDGMGLSALGMVFTPNNTYTQVAILPQPASNRYYVFLPDLQGGFISTGLNGCQYAVVDMDGDGGMGEVVDRGPVAPQYVTEKLVGVRHSNGTDYWIVGHGWENDIYYVAEITAAGLQPTTFTSVGSTHIGGGAPFERLNSIGELRVNFQDDRLVSVQYGDGIIELLDFDASSGTISNPQVLSNEPGGPYGATFSPDGSKLYISTILSGEILQFDLTAPIPADTRTVVGTYPGGNFGSMRVAPDGKLYISRWVGGPIVSSGTDGYLAVINEPDLTGAACDFVLDGFFLDGLLGSWGLNSILEYLPVDEDVVELPLNVLPDSLTYCIDSFTTVSISLDAGLDYFWTDGYVDLNRVFDSPGDFEIAVYNECDTVFDQINIEAIDCSEDDPPPPPPQEEEEEAEFPTDCKIFFPSAFTPNLDGLNDKFKALYECDIAEWHLQIFNRWGEVVFEGTNPDEGWDASFQGKLQPPGMYVYMLQVRPTATQKTSGLTGNVTLLR